MGVPGRRANQREGKRHHIVRASLHCFHSCSCGSLKKGAEGRARSECAWEPNGWRLFLSLALHAATQGQVSDLMLHIEAQERLAHSQDLQDGLEASTPFVTGKSFTISPKLIGPGCMVTHSVVISPVSFFVFALSPPPPCVFACCSARRAPRSPRRSSGACSSAHRPPPRQQRPCCRLVLGLHRGYLLSHRHFLRHHPRRLGSACCSCNIFLLHNISARWGA